MCTFEKNNNTKNNGMVSFHFFSDVLKINFIKKKKIVASDYHDLMILICRKMRNMGDINHYSYIEPVLDCPNNGRRSW